MWLEVVELEDTTGQRYGGLIRRYLRPTFESLPAAKLDSETLERFYARLRRCNRLCARPGRDHAACRPLSPSAVRQIHFRPAGRVGPCGAVALPQRESGRAGGAAGVRTPGAGPAAGGGGGRVVGPGVAGPGVGNVRVADDGDRLPARRDVRAAVDRSGPGTRDPHRSTQSRTDRHSPPGGADEDPAEAACRPRRAHR